MRVRDKREIKIKGKFRFALLSSYDKRKFIISLISFILRHGGYQSKYENGIYLVM